MLNGQRDIQSDDQCIERKYAVSVAEDADRIEIDFTDFRHFQYHVSDRYDPNYEQKKLAAT